MFQSPSREPRPVAAMQVDALTLQMGRLLCEAFQVLVSTLLADGDTEGFNRLANYVLTEHERLLMRERLR